MFTRIVTFTDATDIDSGIDFVRDVVTPVLHSQRGWRGTTVSVNRPSRVFSVLTLWETDADRDASESALLKVRDEGHEIIGGQQHVEYFEQVRADIAKMPTVGTKLLLTRVGMDPAKMDENIKFFGREVIPKVTAEPGFLALRQMVNRKTGDCIVGTTWANSESRRKALAAAEARTRSGQMQVSVRERSERDIVFIDLPK